MDRELIPLDSLLSVICRGDDVAAEQAVLDYLGALGAALRRGANVAPAQEMAKRPALVARALGRLEPLAIESALDQVASARIAVRNGDEEARVSWHDDAAEAVAIRESFECVMLAVRALLAAGPDDALAREVERLAGELAAADAVARPQRGALLVINVRRRAIAAEVRAGTSLEAAWWLDRLDCPDTLDPALSPGDAAHAAHAAACPACRDDRRRAAMLDELFAEPVPAPQHVSLEAFLDSKLDAHEHRRAERHLANCAECTAQADAIWNARAIAATIDAAKDISGRTGGALSDEQSLELVSRHEPRAHSADVSGVVDGHPCRARVVVVPDAPIGPDTELSVEVHDAPSSLRGRAVRLSWKDGGPVGEARFDHDSETNVPLASDVIELRGAVLRNDLLPVLLRFEVAAD